MKIVFYIITFFSVGNSRTTSQASFFREHRNSAKEAPISYCQPRFSQIEAGFEEETVSLVSSLCASDAGHVGTRGATISW